MGDLREWDRLLTLWVNQPAGKSPALDKFAIDVTNSALVMGGIYVAIYWWLWFEHRIPRRDVVVALVAAVAAVIVSRQGRLVVLLLQRERCWQHAKGRDRHHGDQDRSSDRGDQAEGQ